MSNMPINEKAELYERALAQIRLLLMSPPPAEYLVSAIMAILETAGMTARLAQYYKEENK